MNGEYYGNSLRFQLDWIINFYSIFSWKKIFQKKKMLHDHEQEIILDEKIIHLGPFSGNPYRKLAILLAFSSSYLSQQISTCIPLIIGLLVPGAKRVL